MHLHKGGAKILGTSPEMIDNAEDRCVYQLGHDPYDFDGPVTG